MHILRGGMSVIKDLSVAESVRRGLKKALFAVETRKEEFKEGPGVVEILANGLVREGMTVERQEG